MPTSVRLDSRTEQALARLAREKGASKSAVLREAVEALARKSSGHSSANGPFERAKDLIGCVSGGEPDLSTRTGAGFRQVLGRKVGR